MFTSDRYDWNLWLWWVIQTTAGYSLAMIVLVLAVVRLRLPVLAGVPETESPSFWLQLSITPLFALSGALAGLLQWISLRSVLTRAGWWVLATALGWAVGYLSTILLPSPSVENASVAAVALAPWLAIGLATGFGQWLVLRNRFKRAGWWVPVSGLAVTSGAAGWIIGSVCGGVMSWSAAGAVTGLILVWLLGAQGLD